MTPAPHDVRTVEQKLADIEVEFYANNVKDRLANQIQFVQEMLKNLTLVNGGAIIALFTLMGNKVSINRDVAFLAFGGFGMGLIFTFGAWLAAFWCQERYARSGFELLMNAKRRALGAEEQPVTTHFSAGGDYAFQVGVALCILGLLGFIIGSFYALASVMVAK